MTAMTFHLDRERLADFEAASQLEWLETNGLGGYAASTVVGAHTRRYHGLLVAATTPPTGRRVLLSRLDETVRTASGETFALGASRFPGVVHPHGFQFLESFERGLFPVWRYRLGGLTLTKTVVAPRGESTTVVLYHLEGGGEAVQLDLLPLFAGRDYHALGHASIEVAWQSEWSGEVLSYRSRPGLPVVSIQVPGGRFEPAPGWWYRFELDRERERGFDFQEDLFTPGQLGVELAPGGRLGVIVSTGDPAGRDAFALAAAEAERRRELVARVGIEDPLIESLTLAADQFLVRRGRPEEGLSTVIAGYPWFADWGRDTMIALPGLALATRRFEEARGILRAFAGVASEGMLPNRFADEEEAPEYNTADASLWFFQAVAAYLEATGDEALVRDELWPALVEILAWHERGTRYGIYEDEDGLLHAGEPGVQLTWMDAKVGDWVVTPRSGKPVEIQALWANALAVAASLARRFGDEAEAARLEAEVERVKARFAEVYWYQEGGYLYDGVDGEERDASLRPNQLLAISLPLELLPRERALAVLARVEEHLLTPVGLRSLSPEDPRFVPVYQGGPVERDGAYHQGTAWSWLLGPYVDALLRLRGRQGRTQARQVVAAAARHLEDACLGQCSEIFDGAAPHFPRGCFAQAWSVGELLRVAVKLAPASRKGSR